MVDLSKPVSQAADAVKADAQKAAGEVAGAAETVVKKNPKTVIYVILGLAVALVGGLLIAGVL